MTRFIPGVHPQSFRAMHSSLFTTDLPIPSSRTAAQRRRPRWACVMGAGLALALVVLGAGTPLATAPRIYDLAPSSRFEVWTGKAGILGAFGHHHVIRAGTVTGTIVWDAERVQSSRVEVVVPVADLHVVREGADENDWSDVEKAMREAVLHSNLHPTVEFRSRIVSRTEKGVHVVGDLSLEGRSRPVAVDVDLDDSNDSLRANGSFRVRQTDFGIEPYRAAAGTIKVADEVEFRFSAVGTPRVGE